MVSYFMQKERMYFGHHVDTYGTPEETKLILAIESFFPDFDIENPNQSRHGEKYHEYRSMPGRSGMDYFYEEVLPEMAAGVFHAFEDGKFGAGVFGEAEFLVSREKPIWEIKQDRTIHSLTLENSRELSVEDTRARVYG